MVLEARFVSSCLIFPSRAMPLRSRLLASKGTSVSVVVRVLFGGTFSLRGENQRGGLADGSRGQKAAVDPRRPICQERGPGSRSLPCWKDSPGACPLAS